MIVGVFSNVEHIFGQLIVLSNLAYVEPVSKTSSSSQTDYSCIIELVY